ncbi:MAG: DUF4955 domain-containing protein [Opitutaceae bacterium]
MSLPLTPHRPTSLAKALSLCLLLGCPHISQANDSATWQDFKNAQQNGSEPILPDFSYAGYHYSEVPIPDPEHKVFNVKDYGAIPDDGLSDRKAIQAAIDAASSHGSGIVKFGSGRFHLNTEADAESPISLNSGNVILRGSGEKAGGTELFMEKNFEPADPNKMYSTPFMLNIASPDTSEGRITEVTENARRESYTVTVASSEDLQVNQRVTLYLKSTEAVADALAPHTAAAAWERLHSDGVVVKERHIIDSIDGNQITFKEPIHTSINASHGWEIREYNVIEEIGIEDIHFVGNWTERFIHHRSALDDGGWSAIKINNVANSWIRRCTFTNWNYGVEIRSSSAVSVLQVSILGNQAHFSTHTRGGYGVLIGLVDDETRSHHGPSVGYQSAGTVYWNYHYDGSSSWDAHSGFPYATLLDCVKGGITYGRCGGPQVGLPNHWRHFVLWNFEQIGRAQRNYDFWRDGDNKRDRFVFPIIVGLHGKASTFNEANLELMESYGKAVAPKSLFESQLSLRLGGLPQFIKETKDEWKTERSARENTAH